MYTHTHTHTHPSTKKHYLAMIKKDILPFAMIQIDLEDIMLSDVSQTETDKLWYNLYVESKRVKIVKGESKMVATGSWRVEQKKKTSVV